MTAFNCSGSGCQTTGLEPAGPDYRLAVVFLDHLRAEQLSAALRNYASAARHFLLWLDRRGIPLVAANADVVQRFARHRCRCPRYSSRQLRDPAYIGRVRRFIRFLEDRGDIPVTGDLDDVAAHLSAFGQHLVAMRYSRFTQRRYRSDAEHFACWLRLSRLRWRDADDAVIERFARHDCRCPLCRKRAPLEESGITYRRRGAHQLLAFLRRQGAIPIVAPAPEDPRLAAFRLWLEQHCGTTGETVDRYLHEVSRWLPALGMEPATYDAAAIREVVLSQGRHRSRASVRITATVLRAYLRFLAARGACRPELVHAVPVVARRRLAGLPRYASPATIERIIASCDATTPMGIRDRAIILLLARLGLRAGDVCQLRLADLDWENARICVRGKGRRAARLPLPQDAGDAVLAYLERGRPVAREDRVFLRAHAPFTPLASPTEIAGIVARVFARGGITGVPTGAHLFRHSLATAMLRTGASLESVGAILRHRSPSTTAIYAKVDVAMLTLVAQPWPGDLPC
jgi:site-specific recombinase XerD